MRFSDGIMKLMAKKYPDFKGCLYEYKGCCIIMAIVASIQEGLHKPEKDTCWIAVSESILENCFDLMDIDIYDYAAFDDLDIKFSYTRNSEKVKLPLVSKINPGSNKIDLKLNPDFYQVLRNAEVSNLDGVEVLEKCKALLLAEANK